MAKQYYDRYQDYRFGNNVKTLPFLKIPEKSTDIRINYKKNRTRLDIVSQTYYGAPYYGWLIMMANPQYGGLEFDIPDGAVLRIPFPLIPVLQDLERINESYNTLYKINS
jgi:hypothetical protein